MYLIIWENVTKHMYSIYIYKSLLINVSVSLIVSEVLPHMTSPPPPQREDRKLDILENINFSVHKTETCQGNAMSKIYSYKVFMLSSRINQSRIRCRWSI